MSGPVIPIPFQEQHYTVAPVYTPIFGEIGATCAMVLSAAGAAYGTARAGAGISAVAIHKPELVMKSLIPIIMAGIVAIYGLVVGALIANDITAPPQYTLYRSLVHLGAGISVGACGLGAGYAIGVVGDAGVRGTAHEPRLFVGMILVLIFAEVLGLYGLIISLILATKSG